MRDVIETQVAKDAIATVLGYPSRLEQCSSATVRFRTPKTPMATTGVSATRDALTGTVSEAASRGATELTIAITDDVKAGRYYLIKIADGTVLVVQAQRDVDAADDLGDVTIYLTDPLPCDVDQDSDFYGWALILSLTTTNTAEIGRGVIEWTATFADGTVIPWAQDLRVAPRLPAPQITWVDVTSLSPYCAKLQPPDDKAGNETISAVWQTVIAPVLYAKGLRPERIISWPLLNPWFKAACEKHLADQFETVETMIERKDKALLTAQTLVLSSAGFWYDAADDFAEPAEDRPPVDNTTFILR